MSLNIRVFICGNCEYTNTSQSNGVVTCNICRGRELTETFESCTMCSTLITQNDSFSPRCSKKCNEDWGNQLVEIPCNTINQFNPKYHFCPNVIIIRKKDEAEARPCKDCERKYQEELDEEQRCRYCKNIAPTRWPMHRYNKVCRVCYILNKCVICRSPIFEDTGSLLLFCGDKSCKAFNPDPSTSVDEYVDSDDEYVDAKSGDI